MPPPGGYEAIKYKRNLPVRGVGGAVVFSTVAAICAFGFWRVGKGNVEKRELKREQAWSRINLVPLLLAEQDRDAYRRQQAALAREKEIMKDYPGWEVNGAVIAFERNPSNIWKEAFADISGDPTGRKEYI
ncbi:NADH dehydrogenase (ubiquinone) 1 alpha subcomplex 13 [Kwoniella mangroviensis CBS 10435]|uniref:NADH dehydrogenase [ubiquinone] 1 alpha subcomplex subunit 13 n=1 Tax=Kwoniella mangroviensis CBS 10435 TaxID=1331196 RepID=A0A1B9J243_9TREE|nr:NADH dehydrogenase (ubiquinone) 1 alpha subcomplex 13 [Kwoniella mangroviensis CBS 10435]